MSDDTDDDGHTVGERILLARAETAESELATATTTMELAIRKLEAAEAERDRLKAHVARHREQMDDYERLEAERDRLAAELDTATRLAMRQRARVEELEAHPEATCDKCGGANHTWSAPNDLWNATVGTPDNPRGEGLILCPTCFTRLVGARVEELKAALREHTMCITYPNCGDCPGCRARNALDKEAA